MLPANDDTRRTIPSSQFSPLLEVSTGYRSEQPQERPDGAAERLSDSSLPGQTTDITERPVSPHSTTSESRVRMPEECSSSQPGEIEAGKGAAEQNIRIARRKTKNLWYLFFARVSETFGRCTLPALLPFLVVNATNDSPSLNIDYGAIVTILALGQVAYALGTPIVGGKWVDIFRPREVLIGGVVGVSAAAAFTGIHQPSDATWTAAWLGISYCLYRVSSSAMSGASLQLVLNWNGRAVLRGWSAPFALTDASSEALARSVLAILAACHLSWGDTFRASALIGGLFAVPAVLYLTNHLDQVEVPIPLERPLRTGFLKVDGQEMDSIQSERLPLTDPNIREDEGNIGPTNRRVNTLSRRTELKPSHVDPRTSDETGIPAPSRHPTCTPKSGSSAACWKDSLCRSPDTLLLLTVHAAVTSLKEPLAVYSTLLLRDAVGMSTASAIGASVLLPLIGSGSIAISHLLFSTCQQSLCTRRGHNLWCVSSGALWPPMCLVLATAATGVMAGILLNRDENGGMASSEGILACLGLIFATLELPRAYLDALLFLKLQGKEATALAIGYTKSVGAWLAVATIAIVGWSRGEYGWGKTFVAWACYSGVISMISVVVTTITRKRRSRSSSLTSSVQYEIPM